MYGLTRSASRSEALGGHIDRLLQALTEHGVKTPAKAAKAQQEWVNINAHINTTRSNADPVKATAEIVAKLATGTGTIMEVLTAASATALANDPATTLIYLNATIRASRDFATALESTDWVAHLKPYADTDVATITAAIPEGFQVNLDARDATPQTSWLLLQPAVAAAWRRLTLIHEVTRTFRAYKITPSTFQRDDHYEWQGEATSIIERAGDSYEYSIRDRMIDKSLDSFVWATGHGLTPSLYTDDTVNTSSADDDHDDHEAQHTQQDGEHEHTDRKPIARKLHPGEHAPVVA